MVVPGFIKTLIITAEMLEECLRRAGRINMEANAFYGYIRPLLRDLISFISEENHNRRMENYNRMLQLPADIKVALLAVWNMLTNYFNRGP